MSYWGVYLLAPFQLICNFYISSHRAWHLESIPSSETKSACHYAPHCGLAMCFCHGTRHYTFCVHIRCQEGNLRWRWWTDLTCSEKTLTSMHWLTTSPGRCIIWSVCYLMHSVLLSGVFLCAANRVCLPDISERGGLALCLRIKPHIPAHIPVPLQNLLLQSLFLCSHWVRWIK